MGSGVKGNYSERQQLSLGPGSQGDFEQLISHPFVLGRTEEQGASRDGPEPALPSAHTAAACTIWEASWGKDSDTFR